MALEDWMPTLKAKMAVVSGITRVLLYDELPGSLMEFPALVIVPARGSQEYGLSSPAIAMHQVQMTLYVAGQVLPEGYGLAVPFIKKVRNQLAVNVKLDRKVNYILPVPPPGDWYDGPTALRYGDKIHFGINFYVIVKETEPVTVTP